jgi:ABC-type transporter Mla MlaB component
MTLIRIAADLTRADIPGLCADLADRLRNIAAGGTVVCDVRAVIRPDVVTVEALARLCLTARRHGYTIAVANAPEELLALIGLLGLSESLLSLSEPLRQAEQREEAVGVEERVDARDPPG